MKLTLKSLKTSKALSEETAAFTATLLVDGKPVGTVRNQGTGGSHMYLWDSPKRRLEVETWAEQQPTEFDFEKLDQLVDALVAEAELTCILRRWTKMKTVYRLKGDIPDSWRIFNVPYTPKVKARLLKDHGDQLECFANEDIQKAAALQLQLQTVTRAGTKP